MSKIESKIKNGREQKRIRSDIICPTYFKISQTYFWLYLNALKINKILYGQMRTWN